jgi:hypothetical protein
MKKPGAQKTSPSTLGPDRDQWAADSDQWRVKE